MSRDVYDSIDFGMLNVTFLYQCGPVLAGLKISNLLIIQEKQLSQALSLITGAKLQAFMLNNSGGKVTILVYDKAKLEVYLKQKECITFLKNYGHKNLSLNGILFEIGLRYRVYMRDKSQFPDELGIVLGYPILDVRGYIDNNGKNFILNGYWKVYSNAETTKDLFNKFDEATEMMIRRLLKGDCIKSIISEKVA